MGSAMTVPAATNGHQVSLVGTHLDSEIITSVKSTGLAGVIWGIYLFGESHSAWVWGSVVTMMLGLALVTPRRTDADAAEAS